MAQNGPGKPNKPADDGFSDTAGDGPPEDPPSSWLESGETSGMFADTASAPDAPGYEVRTVESTGAPEDVGLQDRARDASADAYAEAVENANAPVLPDVEAPVLHEATDAPDPYEFKDDGTSGDANSWVDAEPVRSWTPDDDYAPTPDLLVPDAPEGQAPPAKSGAPPGARPAAKTPARPAASGPARPAASGPARPAASGPARPAASAPARPSGGAPAAKPGAATPKPAAPAPAPAAASGPAKPPLTPAPRATASGPVKPVPARPAATPPSTPKPDAGTPKPGKKGGFDLDNLFQRAKDIKKPKDDKTS